MHITSNALYLIIPNYHIYLIHVIHIRSLYDCLYALVIVTLVHTRIHVIQCMPCTAGVCVLRYTPIPPFLLDIACSCPITALYTTMVCYMFISTQ